MINDKRKALLILVSFSLSLFLFGCATTGYRAHPQLEIRLKDVKTAALISPDIKVYEFTAGGVRELRDDWCLKGRDNVQEATIKCLHDKLTDVRPTPVSKEAEEELEDVYALYKAVSTSIQLHIYGPFGFPEKKKHFDYSVGSIKTILENLRADVLIFVYGSDEISTSGRKALQAGAITIGVLTGVMVIPRGGITEVSVGIVDASGSMLWYNVKRSEGGYDLRDRESATNFLAEILSDFPRFKK
jgi:hypothetical protein